MTTNLIRVTPNLIHGLHEKPDENLYISIYIKQRM